MSEQAPQLQQLEQEAERARRVADQVWVDNKHFMDPQAAYEDDALAAEAELRKARMANPSAPVTETASKAAEKNGLPEDLSQFSELEARVAIDKNGQRSRHVNGINKETGKRGREVSADKVLAAYGYDASEAAAAPKQPAKPVAKPGKTPFETQEGANSSRKDINVRNKNGAKASETSPETPAETPVATKAEPIAELPVKPVEKPVEKPVDADLAAWNKILRGPEAQKIFAEGGEEAYLAYIKKQLAMRDGNGPKAIEAGDHTGKELMVRGPQNPEVPLPDELSERLTDARERFTRLAALRETKISRSQKKELQAARDEYNAALSESGAYVALMIQSNPELESSYSHTLQELAVMGAVIEVSIKETMIAQHKIENTDSKYLKKFYAMWGSWGGRVIEKDENGDRTINWKNLWNRTKKVGTMTVIGLPFGIVGAAAGATVFGPIAGAVAAGAVGRGIAKGLFGAKLNKEGESTVADKQHAVRRDQTAHELSVQAAADAEWMPSAADVIDDSVTNAEKGVSRNRKRIGAAAVLGAAGGAIGVLGVEFAHDHIFGGGGHTPVPKVPKPTPPPELPGAPAPSVPPHIELNVTDTRFPWTHMTERIGSNGTPKILELVPKGQAHGWIIDGNGQAGGSGAITRMVTPDGQTIDGSDLGRVNAALDYIDSNYN